LYEVGGACFVQPFLWASQMTNNADNKRDWFDARLWKILAVAILGPLLATLDATVVNVSLSTLARELGATIATIQWVTSGYLLALGLTLPLTGWLVDRIGTKRLYLLSFSAFTLGSMLCGISWSATSLIAFRALQGMAGGVLAPMAQMMMARHAGRQLARVMGYAAFPVLLGPIVGPVLAGTILQHASWRWLFYINMPVGVLAVVLALRFLPDDHRETKIITFDLSGFVMLSSGLVLLLYGADHANQRVGEFLVFLALMLLACFVAHARRIGTKALIDLHLFRSRVFSFAAITQFLNNGIGFAGQMLVPLYLTVGCHLSSTRTGWMLAPLGIGMLCFAPFLGSLTERFGFRMVASGGALMALMSTIPFAYMANHQLLVPVVIMALFVRGAGLASISIPSMSAAYATIPREELPMATTAINVLQRFGGPMLTTIVSIFLASKLTTVSPASDFNQGFAGAFWFLFAFHALCLVFTLGLPTFLGFESGRYSGVVVHTAEGIVD
jgi:EmrB/QacA subfamily drug resistance transporter